MNMNSECPVCKRAIDMPWTMVAGLRVHKSCERDALEQNRNDLLKELSDLRLDQLNAAEHQRDALLNVLHNIGAKLEFETMFFNCGACEATEKAVDECIAIIRTCLIGTKWERKDG
jgi:GH24 family phage-related lysozyme (muramidase)